MNIHTCRKGTLKIDGSRKNDLLCLYRIVKTDDEGNIISYGCAKCAGKQGHDNYNLFPEVDESGDIVYQETNQKDPWKLGETTFIEESLTQHQSGKTYNFRTLPADIHPEYSVSEHNNPIISENTDVRNDSNVGEIFGDGFPTLVSTAWTTEKYYGINKVEVCNEAIYGKFNIKSNMIMHACLRSYIGTPGWINYTYSNESINKKELYIGYASDEKIKEFAFSHFKNEKIANIMYDAMLLVKKGVFINLWTLMTNNFVDDTIKKSFMAKTSFISNASIYKGRINLKHFCDFYRFIDKMTWIKKTINADGKQVKENCSISSDIKRMYKENILNWILNYPELKNIELGKVNYSTSQRYWYVLSLAKLALKEKILNANVLLPNWLSKLAKDKIDPEVRLFGELTTFSKLPAEYKSEYISGLFNHTAKDTTKTIDNIYPSMRNIKKDIYGDMKLVHKAVGYSGWGQFCEILKLGQKWSMAEIRNAFEHFIPSWIKNDPSIFYNWLFDISELPIDPIYTVTQDEYNELLKKAKKASIAEIGSQQLLEHGASDFDFGDGALSSERAFVRNILDASIKPKDWETWDDWNVCKIPISKWYEATTRLKVKRNNGHNVFWTKLASCGGLKRDNKARQMLINAHLIEALESNEESLANLSGVVEGGLDINDVNDIESLNDNYFIRGEELCLGEE